MEQRQTRAGDYVAMEGPSEGVRAAYVVGPLAACWTFEDAERLARRMDEKARQR